jgi:uncharacterized protein (TIGR03437 family)
MFPRALLLLALASCVAGQSVHFEWVQQIGGSQSQTIAGVGTDAQGNTYVAGNTGSLDFPVKGAVQAAPGGSGLFRIDGPAQWQNLYQSGFSSVSLLVPDPSSSQTMYALAGGDLARSTDSGASWSAVAGFDAQAVALAVDPSAGNILYIGTAGKGILKSTDRGATFTPINNGILSDPQDGRQYAYGVWVDLLRPSVVFANTSKGLARSSDGGANWTYTQLASLSNFSGMAFDSAAPGVVYVATVFSIQKSTDDGVTWSPLPGSSTQQFEPTAILLDPVHRGTIYAGGYTGLWKSTDGGATWNSPFGNQVFALTAGANGTIYFASGGSLYTSADGLATMIRIGPVLPIVSTLAVLGTHLFAGSQGSTDVFIAKFDPQGNVAYATYFGGAASEQALAMTVDRSGAVYVTGLTSSSDFPVSPGAYAKSGGNFLLKLNADGSLAYSTYFSPPGTIPVTIAVGGDGNAWLAGATTGNLPVTAGAYQTTLQGSNPCCNVLGPGPPPVTNGFLTEFDPSGSKLVFSTYFGSQYVSVTSMTLTPNSEAVVAGAGQLYRMSADGSALRKTASIAGNINTVVAGAAGNVYAGGATLGYSASPFPTTPGAFETAPFYPSVNAAQYGFVTRFDSQFNVTASTLLAGEGGDTTLCLAPAPDGHVYAGGSTFSKAFPLRGAAQGSFAPGTGFVTELTGDLTGVAFSTFAGDTRNFNVRALAPTPGGGVVFAGSTTVPGGTQAFVVKAATQAAMPRIDAVVNAASLLGVALSPGETFVVDGAGFGDDAALLLNGAATPLLAHDGNSLTAAVPLDFAAAGAVAVTVQSGGSTSNQFLAPFQATGPGIFSANGTGAGQAYVLNADGTVNSPANPAKAGAAITIYATGAGHITFTNGYAVTDAPAIVAIAGFGAPGIAAVLGPVTGLPGDVYQISVYVPDPAAFASGNPNLANYTFPPMSPLSIQVNGGASQGGVWIAIGR